MELDFSKLNSLNPLGNVPPYDPTGTPKEQKADNTALETENRPQGLNKLQRAADNNKADKEQAAAILRQYAENGSRTQHLRGEILKGVREGENIYSLFLKAVEALSLTTNDKALYSQIRNSLTPVYGVGLSDPRAINLELGAVEERLKKLQAASETETGDSLKQIKEAIKIHKEREKELISIIYWQKNSDCLVD